MENIESDVILSRVTQNVNYLCNRLGVKKSDIEESAGVSKGYLSRIKPGSNAIPSSHYLLAAAHKLNVTIDDLVQQDLFSLDSRLLKPFQVVTKLLNETKSGELSWTTVTKSEMREATFNRDEVYCKGFKDNFENYPREMTTENWDEIKFLFRSEMWGNHSQKDYSCWFEDAIYISEFESEVQFALMKYQRVHNTFKVTDEVIGLFVNKGEFLYELFSISVNAEDQLVTRMKELLDQVVMKKSLYSISGDYRGVMDLFLSDQSLDKSLDDDMEMD